MQPAEFASLLYGSAQGFIALWRADTKATVWATAAEPWEVDQFAGRAVSEKFDAYFGVCLQAARIGSRGSAATVTAVPGLWADIDFADKPNLTEGSKKKNYPTAEAAEKALGLMPSAPSLRILTGGGIHAYWLFDTPFLISSEADRERIAEIVKGWQGMLKARLVKLGGYGLDSTFDLARVLRLPGTPHTKHANKLVSVDGKVDPKKVPRYELEAIEKFLKCGVTVRAANEKKPAAAPARMLNDGKLVYASESSSAPGGKLYNLAAAVPEFKELWDGKTKRASPSEYDMSLANYAINAGWTDEEAAGLLVEFAKKFQPDHLSKLLRVTGGIQDYLRLTIGKAHDKRKTEASQQANEAAIDELAVEVREAEREKRDPSREVILKKVGQFLGLRVTGFRQTGRREEVYSLLIEQGERQTEIILGNASAIHSSPQKLCERIMAEAGRFVSVSKKLKQEWGAIVSGLIAIREFHDVAEAELSARVRGLIEEHLTRHSGGFHVESPESLVTSAINGRPFVREGKLHVSGAALKRLASEIDKGVAGSDLYVGLKQAGFENVTIQIPTKHTSKSYWKGPTDGFCIAPPADPRTLEGEQFDPGGSRARRARVAP